VRKEARILSPEVMVRLLGQLAGNGCARGPPRSALAQAIMVLIN
jgi:hypothetical protein